jgi:transposase
MALLTNGLYLPAIKQSRRVLARHGLLYIGDSTMEADSIRATLAAGNDFYLTPLNNKGAQTELLHELLEPVWAEKQTLTDIYDSALDAPDRRLMARAFEKTRSQEASVEGDLFRWDERVLVVYSPDLADHLSQNLSQRLQRVEEQLLALTPQPGRGRRQWSELAPLQAAADAILKRHHENVRIEMSRE